MKRHVFLAGLFFVAAHASPTAPMGRSRNIVANDAARAS